VIPGNDDALRAIRLFASRIADAIMEGRQVGTEGATPVAEDEEAGEIETGESSIDIEATMAKAGIANPDDEGAEVEIEAEEPAAVEVSTEAAPAETPEPAAKAPEESNEAAAS
jgi:small subunit ribosomal protein S2